MLWFGGPIGGDLNCVLVGKQGLGVNMEVEGDPIMGLSYNLAWFGWWVMFQFRGSVCNGH